jgi:hypothetical protein
VVLRPDLPEHIKAAEAGNPEAISLVRGVSRCLHAVESAALRCLACDRIIFHDTDQITAFAVITPFADPRQLIVSAFCDRCTARHHDLLAVVLQRAEQIWDSVHRIDGGHS